jgi:DMSO/TMAO reductase YedYZ molybdopterin-dependent catalytic subunit
MVTFSTMPMIHRSFARRMRFAALAGGLVLATALCCPLPCAAQTQTAPQAALLTIVPLGAAPVEQTLSALTALPPVKVAVSDEAGVSAEYTGVQVSDLLAAAGVSLGKSIRGERLAEYVLVSAADGYRAIFSLAELDPMFRARPILLCYSKNGGALPDKEGPLRLVVADEQRHARWVRRVTSIRILQGGDRVSSAR